MAKKIWLRSALLLVILTASFYILMPDKVRIDFEKTRTIFKVYEEGKFVISGIEYVRLFDGTKLMRANSRFLDYNISYFPEVDVIRRSFFKESISILNLYSFDGDIQDVEQVPLEHNICFFNAQGKIFEYMIDKVTYDGNTTDIVSPFSFGKNMKLTFQDGYYRAKVYNYKYASDKIKIRYRITEDFQCFNIRLFDPILESVESDLKTKQECTTEFWKETETTISDCVGYTTACSDSPVNKTCYEDKYTYKCSNGYVVTKNKTTCVDTFYKYGDEVFNAFEWCCYNNLCGHRIDYDCNYIEKQNENPSDSYKNLINGFTKIDSKDAKDNYYKEKPNLATVSFDE